MRDVDVADTAAIIKLNSRSIDMGVMHMNQIQIILDKVVKELTGVRGVKAVVLGGSRARGTHSPDSDIDIGIYYDAATLDLAALHNAARDADDEHRENLIAAPGEWGDWVNGGGWLTINGVPVDLLLRDVTRVEKVIAQCQAGVVTAHYQPGHPHAYINAMYMGELAVSKMLWDPDGDVSALKCTAESYPPKLKAAIIAFFSFEADFSLMLAEKNAGKNDPYYISAHVVRSVSALNQLLFAVNEQYCLNEKKAVKMIGRFAIRPDNYKNNVDAIFGVAASDQKKCMLLKHLVDETKALL